MVISVAKQLHSNEGASNINKKHGVLRHDIANVQTFALYYFNILINTYRQA